MNTGPMYNPFPRERCWFEFFFSSSTEFSCNLLDFYFGEASTPQIVRHSLRMDVHSDSRGSPSCEERLLKKLLWSCSPDSVWLQVLVVFYSCVGWVQSNICTKASYLVSTLHLFCAGQNHNVMCKKTLRMNFLVTRFFSEHVSGVCEQDISDWDIQSG